MGLVSARVTTRAAGQPCCVHPSSGLNGWATLICYRCDGIDHSVEQNTLKNHDAGLPGVVFQWISVFLQKNRRKISYSFDGNTKVNYATFDKELGY